MGESAAATIAVAFLASLLLSPVVLRIIRSRGIVDRPSERSSHQVDTPRGGGTAVLAGILIGAVVGFLAASGTNSDVSPFVPLAAIVLIGAIGFLDDLYSMRATMRLGGQAALAALFVGAAHLDVIRDYSLFALPVAALFIVGYINAFNFMDGINGISSFTAAIVGATMGIVGLVTTSSPFVVLPLAASAAAVGFAPYNFPRAKMFLGDVGSYTLGATIAVSAVLLVNDGAPIAAIVLPLGVYLADVASTLISRLRRGQPLLESHREHTYQRLANGPWGHSKTTIVVAFVTLGCSVLAVIFAQFDAQFVRIVAMTAGVMLVGGYLALPAVARPSDNVSATLRLPPQQKSERP